MCVTGPTLGHGCVTYGSWSERHGPSRHRDPSTRCPVPATLVTRLRLQTGTVSGKNLSTPKPFSFHWQTKVVCLGLYIRVHIVLPLAYPAHPKQKYPGNRLLDIISRGPRPRPRLVPKIWSEQRDWGTLSFNGKRVSYTLD